MRSSRWLLVAAICSLVVLHFACSDDAGNNTGIQCSDGIDNDGDGLKDFPDDPGCTGEDDETENSTPSPQCSDGRDNDGDGKHDFPNDPGCFAPNQDSEEDDCPTGPGCPQCSNGKDDDGNGVTDFPNDAAGCMSASDTDEYTENPAACGSNVFIDKIPFTGEKMGTLMAGAQSRLMSPTCGGSGTEDVYRIRVQVPKVIVATTDLDATAADTVLYLRSEDCTNMSTEVMCNDNIDTANKQSTLTASIATPGTYYLVVDSKDSLGGAYSLKVNYYIGEGVMCLAPDECGPGLVCRVRKGDTMKTCSKHICEDGLDEDNDGKNDYPDDPGCANRTDDDETDTCPGVSAGCPECADGIDNDGDGGKDYGGAMPDATCSAASSASEACVSTEGVTALTTATFMDTTVGATNDFKLPPGTTSCSSTSATAMAPDKTYRLDLPAMTTLNIINTNNFDATVGLLNSTCSTAAPIACENIPDDIHVTNLAAGAYYYVVDGYSSTTPNSGSYTITVSGTIVNGQSCESPLAQAGAITCSVGYTCQGTAPNRTCQPAACSDGIDNEAAGSKDNKIDFPNDPGCDSPGDNDETDPGTLPVCSDGVDNDVPTDGVMDWPADYGCSSAVGTSEAFCVGEADPTSLITTKTVTGNTMGKGANLKNSCSGTSSNAPDLAWALQLPVPVATLVVDTEGSQFDTTLSVRTTDCATELKCDDEGGVGTNTSKITLTGVAPGGYAIVVDGWLTTSQGPVTVNVQGTVSQGTICSSPLFSGGASAVLVCPAGTTCKGTPIPKCLP